MMTIRIRSVLLAVLLIPAARGSAVAQQPELPFDRLSPASIEAHVAQIVAAAQHSLDRLFAARGPRTVANTLRPYDDFRIELNAARVVSLLRLVHPDSALRAAAARAEARLDGFNQTWRADPRLRAMLGAVDTTHADAETRYWLSRELENFRQEYSGDSATRARRAGLEDELDRLQRVWDENPRYDTLTVAFDSAALVGMSPDWLSARARGPRGEILVGDEELRAVVAQAPSSATREQALVLSMRPRRNQFVLDTLLRTRYAFAALLGARSWAAYQFRDHMVGSPERVRAFLDEARRLSEPSLRSSIERRAQPGSTSLLLSDLMYNGPAPAGGAARPDLAALRPYLPYTRVRDGMLDLAHELLGLEFRPAPDLPVWEPTVEPYRVFESGRLVARVYLDVHFRPGKSVRGASAANFRLGVRDRAITEAAIIAGMIRARPGDTALMGPQGVAILFHEFGHLLHYIVSVRPWFATSGLPTEFDLREVPSILFEEWGRDPAVLGRFARHYRTGEPAPAELLERVRAAGREEGLMGQWTARFALELHDRPPGNIDSVVRQTFVETLPAGLPISVRLPAGDLHPEVALPHLGGYAAAYYTYLWDAAIAKDLLTRFDQGLLDPVAVRRYREYILEPGRSRPAMELIEGFLGRKFSLDAWARSLAPP